MKVARDGGVPARILARRSAGIPGKHKPKHGESRSGRLRFSLRSHIYLGLISRPSGTRDCDGHNPGFRLFQRASMRAGTPPSRATFVRSLRERGLGDIG